MWEIFWEFLLKLSVSGVIGVKVVFLDVGVVVMLWARWGDDVAFEVASVDDRNLVMDDFEGVLVFVVLDLMFLEKV